MLHTLNSTDLAPAEFYLFHPLKSALKGCCFCNAADVIKNATEELKKLSQSRFQLSFQYHYSRWQKYLVIQGSYFEGLA
jgi:hypothetical protein